MTPSELTDPEAILERHSNRRVSDIPTVSILVGPVTFAERLWSRWANISKRRVVIAPPNQFPVSEWIRVVAEEFDLPSAAIRYLAQRSGRDPQEFLAEWRSRTAADRDRFWNAVAPQNDDELLREMTARAPGGESPAIVASFLSGHGERIIPLILRLNPLAKWPCILFIAHSPDDLSSNGQLAAQCALRMPGVPLALAVPGTVWTEFLQHAPESRTKAILREGELKVPVIDPATVERTLLEAGAEGSAVAILTAAAVDAALLESAVAAVRFAADPPTTSTEDDNARSAAERFLFSFLESLPETVGRFELNGSLDFHFGPRLAEVDLLCRSLRLAIEVDGYFHFLGPDGYRRDRMKDWELQRRGYLVLRFLAADVIPQLELIRDRILDALNDLACGACP